MTETPQITIAVGFSSFVLKIGKPFEDRLHAERFIEHQDVGRRSAHQVLRQGQRVGDFRESQIGRAGEQSPTPSAVTGWVSHMETLFRWAKIAARSLHGRGAVIGSCHNLYSVKLSRYSPAL